MFVPDSTDLSPTEKERYARHLLLPDVGLEGQLRMKSASILCIGAGGLGSPVTLYLAAAGIGRIGIVDPDVVERTNLQRQVLFSESDIGRPKIEAARDRLLGINPHLKLDLYPERFTAENAVSLLEPYDVLVDGTDNFATRYLSNDVAAFARKPNVYGSIFRFEGQVSVFHPSAGGPCYRCMFPTPPEPGLVPSCAEGGVLGVLPGIVGSLQAAEAIKLILGKGEPLIGKMVHVDTMTMRFREFKMRKDPECPVCGENPSITEPVDYEAFCGVPAAPPVVEEISVQGLKKLRDAKTPHTLLDVRGDDEIAICEIAGSIKVPLPELEKRMSEIPQTPRVVIHCKSGVRSANAAEILLKNGFPEVTSVAGGINAWSEEIDSEVALY
ncbi:molybdopterin-synthase adenylyltransferase MoeB [Verrucomicrobiales bacterium]|nr:molybdopterin-synthase adenylyltransferase MoeB [Verrucomicrobiales bacterium]